MRLGLFTVADAYADAPGSPEDRLDGIVRLAETAETAGLHSLWVAEHHFHDDGVCPSPAVLLAACAARTRRLRLGSLVSVLPFHPPVDLAEQYAMVDRLSGGRLNLGVGSGYLAGELAAFGIEPADRRARFDAAYDLLLAALRGEPIRAGGPQTPPVRLNVRPVQRPHPPVWIAVQRREALPFVARRGASVALIPYATVAGLDELATEIAEYRAALPPGSSGEVAAAVHVYVGEETAPARTAFRRYVESRIASGSTHLLAKGERDPGHATPEGIEQSGLAVLGRAPEVVPRLEAFARAGVDELLAIVDFGALGPELVRSSVRALGQAWRDHGGAAR